ISVAPATICTGTSTTLTAIGTGAYSWSTGETTSGITVTPANTTTYTVTVINGNCTASTSVQVTVGSVLLPLITGKTTICAGGSTTLTANGGGTYSWNTGETTSAITVTPTNTTTYTVTVINGNCSGSATVQVTISSPPAPTISGTASICAGGSTTLTASGGGSYSWNTGATTTAINVSPTITTTYTLIANNSGCTGSTMVIVTVTSVPTINASGGSICAGKPILLTATGTDTYTWIPTTGLSPSTGAIVVAAPTTSTTYTITGTSTATGCKSTTTVIVTVLPTPIADFIINPSGIVAPNTVVSFTDISTNGGSPIWDFGDPISNLNNTSTLTSPTHKYTSEDGYCIRLISIGIGCSDTIIKCIEVIDEAIISIPNVFTPNGDNINDVWFIYTKGVKELDCAIYDRWGLKMYEWNTVSGGWDGRAITGNNAPDGVYYFIMKAIPSNNAEPIKRKGFLQLLQVK
ncbi:MAG: gliding motility-associated C-terminal domain-containing protein, partial [Bacteroidetes bacterium]|nr:gliding motility-associated C-terminal domain-containing protein [Bacteroidota bacterium]